MKRSVIKSPGMLWPPKPYKFQHKSGLITCSECKAELISQGYSPYETGPSMELYICIHAKDCEKGQSQPEILTVSFDEEKLLKKLFMDPGLRSIMIVYTTADNQALIMEKYLDLVDKVRVRDRLKAWLEASNGQA